MFGKKQEFDLPEMPGVCLSCGARGPLAPAKFEFRYTSKLSILATILALCAGILYTREMVYRLELPVCGACSAHLKRAKTVMVLGYVLFLPTFLLVCLLTVNLAILLGTPAVYIVAACVYHSVLRGRGTPKVAHMDNERLAFNVPGYGVFVLVEPKPKTGREPRRQAAPAQTPKLNRSVCEGCGFINFPNVLECKKCHAPLGAGVGV